MIRFGITKLKDIPEGVREPVKGTPVSLALLDEISGEMTPRNEQLLEFLGVATPSGFSQVQRRRTYVRRYRDVDAALKDIVISHFGTNRSVHIHEVASSNGICALETYRLLSQDCQVTVHASDYHTSLYQVTVPGASWSVIFDDKNRPLQFVGKNMVLWISSKEPSRYPINRLIKNWLMRTLLPTALKILQASPPADNPSVRTISLFHPACVNQAETDPNFSLGYADMFELPPKSCDVLRIMSAFAGIQSERLRKGLQRVAESITDQGILIIGLNTGRKSDVIDCSFFKRTGNRLTHLLDIGAGADEKALVLELELEN